MAFVDECTVFARRRARRERLGVAALRAVQAPRRPRRRQRRRRRLDRLRGLPRRARPVVARRPSPPEGAAAASPGASAKREGASGKDLVVPVPDGTVVIDERGPDRRPGGRGHARRGGREAAGGPGQRRPSRALGTACPAPPSPARTAREAHGRGGAPHGRRRRAGGAAERGQVHAAGAPHRRQAQDRQLSRSPRSRRTSAWRARTPTGSWWPTSPGWSRAPARARGWGTGSCGTSCDAGRWCWWSTWRREDPAADLATLRAELGRLRPRAGASARRSWWARRPTWSTTPAVARSRRSGRRPRRSRR